MTAHKRLLVLVLGAMAGMVVAASAAFACANLVAINLSEHSAAPGSVVEFRVDGLRDDPSPDAREPRAVSDVVVHWNGHDGQELARGRSVNRTVSGSFTIPNVPAGQYMVLATQTYTDTGDPVPGAPARTTIEITAGQASGAAATAKSSESDAAAAAGAPAQPAQESSPAPPAPAEQPAAPHAAAVTAPPAAAQPPAPSTAAAATAPPAAGQPVAPSQAAAASSPASAVSPTPAGTPSDASSAAQPASPTAEVAARFAAAERAAGLHGAAPPTSDTAATAAALSAAERASASAPSAASPSPQSTWWSAPATRASYAAILALALAIGAALLSSRRRRHGLGLAVGRLPLP